MALFSALASIATGLLGNVAAKRQKKAAEQQQRRAARGADPITGIIAGSASATAAARGVGIRAVGVGLTPEQQGAAVQWLTALGSGMGDAALRSMASRMRIGKTVVLAVLQSIGQLGADTLQPAEKVLISNEVERIFKKRRRGPISKALIRTIAQLKFLKKNLGFLFK